MKQHRIEFCLSKVSWEVFQNVDEEDNMVVLIWAPVSSATEMESEGLKKEKRDGYFLCRDAMNFCLSKCWGF
jgi:hypothetical protein